jgi:CDP-glucose 4,6-dehydratase
VITLSLDFSSYQNKKVFLTGHTGFKGSWLLAWLHELGANVKGYALEPDQDNALYTSMGGGLLCDSIIADIRNKDRLASELLSFQPDFIFHMAAQPLVRLSYDIPIETWEVNTLGTAYLLEAVRKLVKPCVVVLITTDKVYENREWHYPYRETDRLGGHDPYSASKAGAELVISSYRNSYFSPASHHLHKKSIASARAGNVIGGGDWAKDRIVPDIVRALQKGEEVIVRNPNSVRPWQHVLEPLAGYLQLGLKMQEDPIRFSGAWNFGPLQQDALTVGELVELAISLWGGGAYKTPNLKSQVHEASLLRLDISKTAEEIGWTPKWNAAQAIEKTIQWYLTIGKGEVSPFQFMMSQIKEFHPSGKNV